MVGKLKLPLSELGIRGENETFFRIKSCKELCMYLPDGLDGHIQTSKQGQTLVWTLGCGCLYWSVVGIALCCGVGLCWLTQAWPEKVMGQQLFLASRKKKPPCRGEEEEEQSPAIYKQESWHGVWSQVRVWALTFFIYRYSCSQLAYLWAKKMPELLNYLLSVLFGCHSIAWGRGATMALWRKRCNIHPELSVLLAPKKYQSSPISSRCHLLKSEDAVTYSEEGEGRGRGRLCVKEHEAATSSLAASTNSWSAWEAPGLCLVLNVNKAWQEDVKNKRRLSSESCMHR